MSETTPDRVPDRITYGSWEPIFGPTRKKQVATRVVGALFSTVLEWTEHEGQPVVGMRRQRIEWWDEPERIFPVESSPGLFGVGRTERRTLGRWEWEYAPRLKGVKPKEKK